MDPGRVRVSVVGVSGVGHTLHHTAHKDESADDCEHAGGEVLEGRHSHVVHDFLDEGLCFLAGDVELHLVAGMSDVDGAHSATAVSPAIRPFVRSSTNYPTFIFLLWSNVVGDGLSTNGAHCLVGFVQEDYAHTFHTKKAPGVGAETNPPGNPK